MGTLQGKGGVWQSSFLGGPPEEPELFWKTQIVPDPLFFIEKLLLTNVRIGRAPPEEPEAGRSSAKHAMGGASMARQHSYSSSLHRSSMERTSGSKPRLPSKLGC